MTFLTIPRVTERLCSFRLVLEGKTGKEIPESSRLEFSGKFSAHSGFVKSLVDYMVSLFRLQFPSEN